MARLVSYLSMMFNSLILIHPRSGWLSIVLWIPKLIAEALSPLLAIAGGIGALFGLMNRDRKAVLAGLSGAVIGVQHVIDVSSAHDGFLQAFGPGWETKITADQKNRMLPRRWVLCTDDPPDVPRMVDVVFGYHVSTDDPLLADLWFPPDDTPSTGLAVVYLHGSGWHYGDKDMGTRRLFRHLAGQGHLIMDVAYTLAPTAKLPSMLADVKCAIWWMKTEGKRYGVNPERIVLMGGSAGGHIALLAAYAHDHPDLQLDDLVKDTSVRGVVSLYGPPDLLIMQRRLEQLLYLSGERKRERIFASYLEAIGGDQYINPRELIPNLLGGTPDLVPEQYRLASPIYHVGPDCPPTLLLQGSHDFGGMLPDVRRLHYALLKAGVPSVYVEFPGAEHGFDLIFPKWSPSAQAATYDIERFLALMV